ncbi:hypothetical protein [Polyangium aurulentum]|uniref:hypothetical protein n=1 Tax=Polyangium aurulentum TaxID=2567896 RepID=UPI0010AEC187|nr:hypothetical protein [Polyangium aurulentum]UQA62018.1 hypothetical protein E8A73_016700 [Polyangium aurulentum]
MSPMLRRCLLFLAGTHLLLVVLGAGKVKLRDVGPIGRALAHHGYISGASSGYGFFSARIRRRLVLAFDVIDREGNRTTVSLGAGPTHEADLRVDGIASAFAEPELRRELAASLAGKIFARHPAAREVVVRVENFEVVSMEDYQRGLRPRRTPFYEARFARQHRRSEGQGNGPVDTR